MSFLEPQYDPVLALRDSQGQASLGLSVNYTWWNDPKRLTFVLSRYKFVSKLLAGHQRVLEVGCGDAFGSRIVQQVVSSLTCSDFDSIWLEDARARLDARWPMELVQHDFLASPMALKYQSAYLLDVIEHIPPEQEDTFVGNIVDSLEPHGTLIVGSPSLESQAYASPISKAGHVNCKSGPDLQALGRKFFHHCFLFSMNDEVVHTGFHAMAQYLFILCCEPRPRP